MLSKTPRLKDLFHHGIKWNILGSITFETLRFSHQIALLQVLGLSQYGLVGSTFSFMYLTLHLADFEAGASLKPFLNQITKNRFVFNSFFIRYLICNGLLLFIGSLAALYAYHHLLFSATHLPLPLISGIIVFEGLRIFFRLFLHSVFLSKPTIIIDLIATLGYFVAVWIPYLVFETQLSMNHIFTPYIFSSFFALILFGYQTFLFQQTLPLDNTSEKLPPNFISRLIKTRLNTYVIRLSKHFFTGNFLTPLFAMKFGLDYAGLLKFSSYIADSIKAIINVSIGFSGGALLAKLKNKSLAIKRKVFQALWKTFAKIFYPIGIFIAINFQGLFNYWIVSKQNNNLIESFSYTQPAFLISLVLLFISIMENFFVAYEEFYLIEEQTSTLMLLKVFELTLFFGLVLANYQEPAIILLIAILVRITSFSLLAVHAYAQWKIKPLFSIPTSYLINSVALSLFFLLLLR